MKAISVLVVLSVLLGCSTPTVKFDDTKRAPTTSVEVFRDGNKPTRPYKEIAEMSYETWSGQEAKALSKLVNQAKALGAQAVILQPTKSTGYEFNVIGPRGNKSVWKAIAIVYE